MPTVLDTANRFRTELSKRETTATNQLINAYRLVTRSLQDKLTVLMSRIEVLEEQGNLTPETVRKQSVWSSLLNQLEDELKKYGSFVDTNATIAAQQAIDLAAKHSQLLTQVYFQNNPNLTQAFNATWDRLPSEAIEQLLGFLQPDSQLRINLLATLGVSATQNFQDKLLEGIALGYNPKKINALINQTLGEPLTWSLNTIRTTQLYSYREATRANYINNSEIVGGWKWYATLDGRVCLSCVNQHGKTFAVDQRLNDHHQGRCTQIPIVRDAKKFGLEDLNIELGEQWFNSLPKAEQVQRMGIARHLAYTQGKFRFDELSEVYLNDTFGAMLKEASLKTLLGIKTNTFSSVPKAIQHIQTGELQQKSATQIFRLDSSLSSNLIQKIKDALKVVDQVHNFPKYTSPSYIKGLQKAAPGVQGHYEVFSAVIRIGDKALNPFNTVIHEIGHYIDYEILGNGESVAATSKRLASWREAVKQTIAFKNLEVMKDNPGAYEIDFGFAGKVKPDPEYTSYLLQYDELFARSYFQYILTKTGRLSDLEDVLQDKLYRYRQWDNDDFREIEKELDKFFEEKLWK